MPWYKSYCSGMRKVNFIKKILKIKKIHNAFLEEKNLILKRETFALSTYGSECEDVFNKGLIRYICYLSVL